MEDFYSTDLKEGAVGYKKNANFAGIRKHDVYKINVGALFVISALRAKNTKYKISTDDISAGKFDDLVFEFTYKEEAVSWFLKVRHRENVAKITFRDLLSQKEAFSLQIYFRSYLSVRDQQKSSEKYERRYIIYTPAVLDFDDNQMEGECLTISSGNSYLRFKRVMEEHDLLDISKYSVFQIQPDDFIKRHLEKTPGASDDNIEEFLQLLRFAVGQPTERQLDDIILEKAGEANIGIPPKILRDGIYQRLYEWSKQVSENTEYFTEKKVAKICLQILSDTFKQRIMLDDIAVSRYDEETLLVSNESVFCMFPSSPRLCCNRLIGYPKDSENRYLLRLRDLVKAKNIVIPSLPFKETSILIIVCKQTDDTAEAMEVIESLRTKMQHSSFGAGSTTLLPEQKLYDSKLIFVLSDENMKDLMETKYKLPFLDDTSFESLSSETQALFVKKVVTSEDVPTSFKKNGNDDAKVGLNSHHMALLVSETFSPTLEERSMGFTRNRASVEIRRSQDYEVQIAVLFVISALKENGINYNISTDDISAGKFDDLVFKFTYKGKVLNWFLQVMYRKMDAKITFKDFIFAQKSAFYLRKYFNSFLYIREQHKLSENVERKYIIHTPAVLDFDDNQMEGECLTISSGNSYLRFKRVMEEHDLLGISKYSVFQIQPDDFIKRHLEKTPGASDDNIKEFLQLLRLAVGQPTERQLGHIILEKAGEANIGIEPKILRDGIYQRLNKWAMQVSENTEYFTEKEVAKICLKILSETFKQTILLAGIEFLPYDELEKRSISNESAFYMIPSSLRLCCNRLIKHPKISEKVFVLQLSDLMKVKNIIIPTLPFNETTTTIIVCKQTDDTPEAKEVMKFLIAKMQRPSIGTGNSTFISEQESYDSKLIFVLSDATMQYFMEIQDKLSFLEDDTSFESLSSDTQALLKDKVIRFQGVPMSFRKLCNDDVMAGLNSLHTEIMVSETNVVVGKPVPRTEDVVHHFVPREACVASISQKECPLAEIGKLGKLKFLPKIDNILIVVIAAEPGSGKTTLLYHLAEERKREMSDLWIINESLKDVAIKLKEKNISENISDFMELLIDIFLKDETLLSKHLFRHSLETGKFILLLDGYDEIGSKMKREKVCVLLKKLKENSRGQVIITTKLHLKEELEETTSSLAYRLKPLTVTEQGDLLAQIWIKNLEFSSEKEKSKHVRVYADQLVKSFFEEVGEQSRNMIGIPLQAMLLAEVYEENCKLHSSDRTQEVISIDISNIFLLYETFEVKKCKNFVQKKIKSDNVSFSERLTEIALEEHRSKCMEVAITKLLPDSEYHRNCCMVMKSRPILLLPEEYIFSVGILQKSEGGKKSFIHSTFADYYFALHIKYLFTEGKPCPEFFTVLKEEFYESNFSLVRMFVDNMLANSRYLNAAIENDVVVLKEELQNGAEIDERDALGRTACHLAAAHGHAQALLVLLNSDCDLMARDELGFRALDISLKQRNMDMVKLFPDIEIVLQ